MKLITDTNRVNKCLTYTEKEALVQFYASMENKDHGVIKINTLKSNNTTLNAAIRKLEIVEIIKTQNMGKKGTYFQVVNREALLEVVSNLN